MLTIVENDYEQRFQRSIQKLTIPSWYRDTTSLSKIFGNSKRSIISIPPLISWKDDDKESQRTSDILYVRFPYSYRSCRSSLATSPSPSIHSWHPNHIMSGSRGCKKYEKGIDRVSKSSRWYQPTKFVSSRSKDNEAGKRYLMTFV